MLKFYPPFRNKSVRHDFLFHRESSRRRQALISLSERNSLSYSLGLRRARPAPAMGSNPYDPTGDATPQF